jgi:hypothetical protein
MNKVTIKIAYKKLNKLQKSLNMLEKFEEDLLKFIDRIVFISYGVQNYGGEEKGDSIKAKAHNAVIEAIRDEKVVLRDQIKRYESTTFEIKN